MRTFDARQRLPQAVNVALALVHVRAVARVRCSVALLAKNPAASPAAPAPHRAALRVLEARVAALTALLWLRRCIPAQARSGRMRCVLPPPIALLLPPNLPVAQLLLLLLLLFCICISCHAVVVIIVPCGRHLNGMLQCCGCCCCNSSSCCCCCCGCHTPRSVRPSHAQALPPGPVALRRRLRRQQALLLSARERPVRHQIVVVASIDAAKTIIHQMLVGCIYSSRLQPLVQALSRQPAALVSEQPDRISEVLRNC